MNNKGFTLVELLGVLVILLAIILVAIPSITSTFERNKIKINNQKREVVLSAAEIYVNKYKKEFEYASFLTGRCGIAVSKVKEKELLTDDELLNSENQKLNVEYEDGTVIADIENAMIKYNDGNFEFGDVRACYKKGDVNRDGVLDNDDVQLILNASVGSIEFDADQKVIGDMNDDGEILAGDALDVMQIIEDISGY